MYQSATGHLTVVGGEGKKKSVIMYFLMPWHFSENTKLELKHVFLEGQNSAFIALRQQRLCYGFFSLQEWYLKGNYLADAWNQKSQDHLFSFLLLLLSHTINSHTFESRTRRKTLAKLLFIATPPPPKLKHLIQRFLTFQRFFVFFLNINF